MEGSFTRSRSPCWARVRRARRNRPGAGARPSPARLSAGRRSGWRRGVHVLRQAVPNFAGVIGNVTVIEQSDGLVLIDSGASHGSGQRVVELVRSISSRPVKAVVITHWHNDHPLGLSAILAAWPNAEIIAHSAAVADLEAGRTGRAARPPRPTMRRERVRTLTEAYDAIQANEAARAATPEERAGWARALAARALRLADVPGTHLVLPRRTFTDRLTLPDRERADRAHVPRPRQHLRRHLRLAAAAARAGRRRRGGRAGALHVQRLSDRDARRVRSDAGAALPGAGPRPWRAAARPGLSRPAERRSSARCSGRSRRSPATTCRSTRSPAAPISPRSAGSSPAAIPGSLTGSTAMRLTPLIASVHARRAASRSVPLRYKDAERCAACCSP